ncbi:hypothetical protein BGC31_17110 [Komagataeibacter xylinus]|nr:hypothetical protein H845_1450 [Komagataeibacter xylinus E25]RFP06799.1 hypothetical protein BGC31_17110 [Komagataeibacter xylinus]RFP06809.1 hypothetical protein BFX83_15290 [Komagataeibacter xylinus]
MSSFGNGRKMRDRTFRGRPVERMPDMHGNHARAGHKGDNAQATATMAKANDCLRPCEGPPCPGSASICGRAAFLR